MGYIDRLMDAHADQAQAARQAEKVSIQPIREELMRLRALAKQLPELCRSWLAHLDVVDGIYGDDNAEYRLGKRDACKNVLEAIENILTGQDTRNKQ